MSARAAVIDVGSNSIKALVAAIGSGPFSLEVIYEASRNIRLSKGISGNPPMLQADRMDAGIEAVRELAEDCRRNGPLEALEIVATSAVRTALNGHRFTEAVEEVTGVRPVVLTGGEEADAIAIGVRTDPLIEDSLTDFTVFDLGGGSLELIRFEHHGVTDRASLPLGSVRLTEAFVADPSRPFPRSVQRSIRDHLRRSIRATGFALSAPLVGCSGGLAALRSAFARQDGSGFANAGPHLPAGRLLELGERVLGQDLGERVRISGLPPERADIFPTAFLTFQVLLELSGADGILHSLHNLRYGRAWVLLHPVPEVKGPTD